MHKFIYSHNVTVLYMFRATLCSSSGGQIVCLQHMVSSLSMSGHGVRAVHRLRERESSLSTCVPHGHHVHVEQHYAHPQEAKLYVYSIWYLHFRVLYVYSCRALTSTEQYSSDLCECTRSAQRDKTVLHYCQIFMRNVKCLVTLRTTMT